MTLILETGAGVQNANAYVTTAFIDSYLSNRNRSTENGWDTATSPQKDAAAIAASQYVDSRFGQRFLGVKTATFDGRSSEGKVEFAGLPNALDLITIGSTTYTFVAALSTLTSDNEVLIGATAVDMAARLVGAINQDGAHDVHSSNIRSNHEVGATVNDTIPTQVDLVALQEGESGDDIPLSTAAANTSTVGMINGLDYGSQNLEWPRSGIRDKSGTSIVGIPRNLKWAVAEYAVRSHNAELFQDPAVDAGSRPVTFEKVGPLETKFSDSGSLDLLIRPYPAADYLLKMYLTAVGAIR